MGDTPQNEDHELRVIVAELREKFNSLETRVGYVERNLQDRIEANDDHVKADVDEIRRLFEKLTEKIEERFVSKDQFWPVQTFIYGCIAFISTTVLGALLTMALKATTAN